MIVIKDAMVMIHLAKITLLEYSCNYFNKVIIPEKVYEEIITGENKGYIDIKITKELIRKNKIIIKKIKNKKFLDRAKEFNIQRGEAECIALYWQEKADYFATDDDNVRNKSLMLNIIIIGTPSIILKLYKEKIIDKEKTLLSINELRKIGWFSNSILDKILMEVK